MMNKSYLGDGVYAEIKNSQLILSTENGLRITNTIHLEPEVLEAMLKYLVEKRVIASWEG